VVSQAIIAHHGGTLTIASVQGKGTTATVRLPLSSTGFVWAREV
jgi:signal transduction histidine kinase